MPVVFGCSLLVFFFKQKTAYELRISDWSSDVCSSDLSRSRCAAPARDGGPRRRGRRDRRGGRGRSCSTSCPLICHSRESGNPEIGSASCRDRVCQYV